MELYDMLWSGPCTSEAFPAGELRVWQDGACEALTEARRQALRGELAAGRLERLAFSAVTFRAEYPNANFLRFRDEDLPAFAASFVGQPFLRNHDVRDIGARGGTVTGSELSGTAFEQVITLTVPRDIEAFLNGQIDRFSIAWHWRAITCSVCGADWLGRDCPHWPGRRYRVESGGQEVLCELIFEGPRGKEVSAVNAPAVAGTGVREVLAHAKGDRVMEEWKLEDGAAEVVMYQDRDAGDAEEVAELLAAQRAVVLDARLAASGLPGHLQDLVRQGVILRPGWRVAELDQAIEHAKAAWAKLEAERTVQNVGRPADGGRPHAAGGGVLQSMTAPIDEFQAAMDWLFGLTSARLPVPGLRRIDNLYQAVTGDWSWYGRFEPEQAQLAAANSSTLADLATNAMNRVVIEQFAALAVYRWFEQLVTVQPNDGSTLPMQWISYGGTGDLPTVAEGAAYTESTIADARESSAFVKKGKYVGITLEMIRRSDIARIQAVPRALALDAVRTRSAAIAGIFTANSGAGPTLADDTTALFHANHGNLQTTAFSVSAWKAARAECAKMVELGSGKRLGLYPRFCLVPVDLYDDVLVAFGYGQGAGGYPATPNNDVNPYAESRPGDDRPQPVKVPEWTDTTDWAYLVDPRIFPVLQMSYAQAPGGGQHPTPELFSVASPSSGLMFTNDVLPVKVRDWFAYGVSTWRGVGKRNVAG